MVMSLSEQARWLKTYVTNDHEALGLAWVFIKEVMKTS